MKLTLAVSRALLRRFTFRITPDVFREYLKRFSFPLQTRGSLLSTTTSDDEENSHFGYVPQTIMAKDQLEYETTSDIEVDPRDMIKQRRVATYRTLDELEALPIMHVRCTFNNTYVTICDSTGKILGWKSAGTEGYKNARRGTTFAAQAAGVAAATKARELGIHEVRVKLKGPGSGRQYSLKGFEQGGLLVRSIQDVTPIPHNGCRPKKKRRI